jgi:serine protease AprX
MESLADRKQPGRTAGLALLAAALLLPGWHAAAAPHAARPAGLDPGLRTAGRAAQRVVVTGARAGTQAAADTAEAVRRVGGRVTATLPIVNGAAAQVGADDLERLARDPAVSAVTADRQAHFEDFVYDAATTASNFARTSQATAAWAAGNLGQGVGVAVLDTGVSPMADFTGRLVHGPDLSGEGTTIDSFGHGTVMAGLIAGSGADSATRPGGAFTGIAPRSHVVAVKAAGRNGAVDVSTILQGMHWVSAYRDQFNIRVLNLSWGVASTQLPALDPLNYAVERLWGQGIVVVVAAGNSGPSYGTVTKPGDDPVVLTVGALDDRGDADPLNDLVPDWSSKGPATAGATKPDVIASGRTVVASRSYGSAIEQGYPDAAVAPSYIRGSGTSQATAVTSGLVALLLAARPSLTPDQVKDVLRSTAAPLPGLDANTQGAGRVQLAAALAAAPSSAAQPRLATGLGLLEQSRGGSHVTTTCNGVETVIQGEVDVRCSAWDPLAWTGSSWTGDAWTGVSWKGSTWTGVSWKDVSWSDATWTGVSWKDGTWTGASWEGSTGWSGTSSSTWTGVSWKGGTWTGVSWKDSGWTSALWDAEHAQFLTAFWGPTPPPGRYVAGELYKRLVAAWLERRSAAQ